MINTVYQDSVEIKALVDKFITKTLPVKDWTHVAHLTVGLWYVSKHGHDEALLRIPSLIRKYNESVGIANDDNNGYHETITRFWIWMLDSYWQQVREKMSLLNACNYLAVSSFGDPKAFLKFYSKSLIFSVEARQKYVAPDLQPLDPRLIDSH